jgi:hypothetical protein
MRVMQSGMDSSVSGDAVLLSLHHVRVPYYVPMADASVGNGKFYRDKIIGRRLSLGGPALKFSESAPRFCRIIIAIKRYFIATKNYSTVLSFTTVASTVRCCLESNSWVWVKKA